MSSALGYYVVPTSAVYSATKAAVLAVSEGLRKEHQEIRVSVVSPSYVESKLTDLGGDPKTMAWVRDTASKIATPASAVADAIAYAIGQPEGIDVAEILIRPTVQAG